MQAFSRWAIAFWEIPLAYGRTLVKSWQAMRVGALEARRGNILEAIKWVN